MDATEEEQDIQLQRISADLILDFEQSLTPFLRKQDGSGGTRLRSRVRVWETNRLVSSLLEPFQELPQLLDPHLAAFVPTLSDAYLEHLRLRRGRRPRALAMRDHLLMPLPAAICRLIYTFCKIRGEKVILRFLNVETKYLELVLSAIQDAEKYPATPLDLVDVTVKDSVAAAAAAATKDIGVVPWTWEERYVSLLWLSHLLLAPFDLSTISSVDIEDLEVPSIDGLKWPSSLPGIVFRVVPLAIKYLSSPGKERDGSKALLVRIAMRKDMQELGVLKALIQWALTSLRPKKDAHINATPYLYIGVLSFLAGVLRSSIDTSDMDPYLDTIFYTVHAITPDSEDPVHKIISSSALARKTIIKVIRSIAALILRHPQDERGTEIIEDTISYLLESLADNDTPVRFAASKALSVIALKLDPDMASEVVEAVLDSLNKNVLSRLNPIDPSAPPTRDITNVDPLEWHGLMLTLSHLLYRRSPPAENLADIVSALLTGLAFERRGMGGGSIGTNVRDASCFGIWAMARRYTTAELLAVDAPMYHDASHSESRGLDRSRAPRSILQVLATELAVTASLDSAGNIRRGASAALQELIGRHPDTVTQGIAVVQAVDYHAVALRSRAIKEVALHTAGLDSSYGEAFLDALLGWRGVGDLDAAARRVAGETFGILTLKLVRMAPEAEALGRLTKSIDLVLRRLGTLQQRQVEERHGLLICLTSVIDNLIPELWHRKSGGGCPGFGDLVERLVAEIAGIVETSRSTRFRRPELVAEAASRLIVSSLPVLQAALVIGHGQNNNTADAGIGGMNNSDNNPISRDELPSGAAQLTPIHAEEFKKTSKLIDSIIQVDEHQRIFSPAIRVFKKAIDEWLSRSEAEVVEQTSQAALVILAFSSPGHRTSIIKSWADAIRYRPTSARVTSGVGHFHALSTARRVFTSADTIEQGAKISDAIHTRWQVDRDIETRVSILKSLASSEVLSQEPLTFVNLLAEGLDDYTTTARGDIGSLVRLESLRATKTLWRDIGCRTKNEEDGVTERRVECLCKVVNILYLRVLRLAAEKLDRVRVEAQRVLALSLREKPQVQYTRLTFSSQAYFRFLLKLRWREWLHPDITEAAKTSSLSPSSSSSTIPTVTTSSPLASNAALVAEEEWMAQLLCGFVTSADTGNEDLVMCARAALVDFCNESPRNLNQVATALIRNLRAHTNIPPTTISLAEGVSAIKNAENKNNAANKLYSTKSNTNTARAAPAGSSSTSKNDRILIPTLEILSFLLRVGVLSRAAEVDFRALCALTQRAAYKSGNIRKIEACVRLYGGVGGLMLHHSHEAFPIVDVDATVVANGGVTTGRGGRGENQEGKFTRAGSEEDLEGELEDQEQGKDAVLKRIPEAVKEARRRLGALLFHPWPRVRSLVVDELWGVLGDGEGRSCLLGVDWGRAGKEDMRKIVGELGLG